MISAVLDSNVIISGTLFGGPPAQVLVRAAHGEFEWLISDAIVAELTGVLRRPKFKAPPGFIEQLRKEISQSARLVVTRSTVKAVKNDPEDNRILECAVDGHAQFIVTGDADLLALERFRKVRIVTARGFLTCLIKRFDSAAPLG